MGPVSPKTAPTAPESVQGVEDIALGGEFDIDKLAYAVAMAETHNCTTGGVERNNCFGIMTWDRGFREMKTYNSKQEAYDDFKRIWTSYYGGFPTYEMAARWTGNDRPDNWLNNVSYYFNN